MMKHMLTSIVVAVLLPILLVAGEGIIVGQDLATDGSLGKSSYNYGVVIDLGSGGSRCSIFCWPQNSKTPYVDIQYAPYDDPTAPYYQKIKPGIATFVDNPVAAGPYLKPLFDFIVKKVPSSKLSTTPVFVKGTEGLRSLGTGCNKILDSIYYYASQNYDFLMNETFVGTITGVQEGAYGWITINKLLGNFDDQAEEMMGALDMGHGSTQISFIPENISSVPEDYQFNFTYLDTDYVFYTHSFSGYGYTKALYNANQTAIAGQSASTLTNACMLDGFQYEINFQGKQVPVAGTSNWVKCKAVTYNILNDTAPCPLTPCSYNGAFQPPLVGNFWAISNYVDIESFFDLGKETNVNAIFAAAGKFCGLTWAEAEKIYSSEDPTDLAEYCFGGNYLASLLGNGYGFPGSFDIHFDSKVGDFPATWALGQMIIELQNGW